MADFATTNTNYNIGIEVITEHKYIEWLLQKKMLTIYSIKLGV